VASTSKQLNNTKQQRRDFFKFAKNFKKVTSLKSINNGKYTVVFFLLAGFAMTAQQPGFPFVDAGPDVTLECDDPCTELTATFFDTGETTSYEVTAISYAPPFPFTGGTSVSVGSDDVWSQTIPLPFDFCFFGEVYDEFLIGSNGVVTFDTNNNTPGGFCPWSFSASLPSPSLISASINGVYMDIDPSIGGSGIINFTFFGEAPARTLVVNFPDIPYFGSACQGLTLTSQIVFYETTNIIDVYVENRSSGCTWNSGNALIGIQNVGGTEGIAAPGRNTGDWSATNEAWRFTPNGNSNVDFVWLDENDVVIGTTATIEVCPTETSIYTAQATYTNCNGDVVVETDSVTVTFGGDAVTVDLGEDQSFCDVESFEIVPEITGADPGDVTYLWSTGETTPTITVDQTGTYSVEVTFENCSSEDSVFIEFGETPIIDLGADFETCFENTVFLDASPSNYPPADATYSWFFNGVPLVETTPVIEALEYGTYTVEVTVGICSAEDTVVITPRGDLEVSLGSSISGCTLENRTITASTSEDGVTFTWFLNGNLIEGETSNSIDITLPAMASNLSEVYSVVITKGACTGTEEVEVTALNCTISEGLSPDGSPGFNDNLDLTFLSNRTGIENLQVFNRHGRVVYELNNYVNQWVGQSDNGDKLPTGTYFYVINFSGEDPIFGTQKTGWIYLNRASN
jgi:gliding motility-associated-like protein